jgi:hypothetical protein
VFELRRTDGFVEVIEDACGKSSPRNHGEPSGFGKLAAPLMAGAMCCANRKDLERLKSMLETTPSH